LEHFSFRKGAGIKLRFTGLCPECRSKVRRYRKLDFGDRFKGYKCRKGHLITVMDGSEVIGVRIPFQHLAVCPKCGRRLKVTSKQDFDVEDGVERLVTYVCEAGHWIPHRQLIQRTFSPAPKQIVR